MPDMSIISKALKKIPGDKGGKELISESILTFITRSFSAVVSFAMNMVIARYLGVNESGYFFLALSVITVLATFCRGGSDLILLRFVSIHYSKSENNEMQSVIITLLKRAVIFSLIVAPFIVFGSKIISIYLFKKPPLETTLMWMGLSIPFYATYMLQSWAFQGIKKATHSIVIQGTLLPLLLIVAVFIFSPATSSQLSFIYFILSVITCVCGYLWWKKITTGHATAYGNRRQLINESKPLWTVAMLQTGIQWGGQFIAGAYVKPAELAQFAVAQRTSLLISFVLLAVNLVSAPRFAAYYNAGEMDKLKRYVGSTTRMLVVVSIPLVVVVFIFAPQIMNLFGKGFSGGAMLLRILAVGQLVSMVSGSVGYLLMMSGHQKEMRNINIINGILAIVLFMVLIPLYGALGAAIATSIAIASQNLMAVYQVNKKLGINTLAIW